MHQVDLESGQHLLEGVFRLGEERDIRLPAVLGIVLRMELGPFVPVPFEYRHVDFLGSRVPWHERTCHHADADRGQHLGHLPAGEFSAS